jgi:hypothetical protein
MTKQVRQRRRFLLTPARFFIGLLVVQVFLLLSEKFRWFAFNEQKGWTVLIALGVVGVAVLVMVLWGLVCVVLRRRFQFGVSSLLLFLVAVSVPLGWFAWELQRARRQRAAMEAIKEAGGVVLPDCEYDENGKCADKKLAAPTWLRTLIGYFFFADAGEVSVLRYSYFDDEDMRHIASFKHLRYLVLGKTEVTDAGLRHLSELHNLKHLTLNNTNITDSGLTHVGALTNLKILSLAGTEITDEGLGHLEGMTELQELRLHRTQITDRGIEHLNGMTQLKSLWVGNTNVTDQGISQLQQALPNCRISTDPPPYP